MSKSDNCRRAKKVWVKPVVEKSDAAVVTQNTFFTGFNNDGTSLCSS